MAADNPVGDKFVADLKDQLTLGPARRAVSQKIDSVENGVKSAVGTAKQTVKDTYNSADKFLTDKEQKYLVKQGPAPKAQRKGVAYKR